ncbi:nuclear transport factor 2 family protein [Sphingomonas solaris]|uniref:Nuclear transport factor 2 family protein n=1 Tax=Alterirhizorhabdus solaris TaxID=2529389 RepID=A0A558R5S6_9SPHN|nr:nuclear transport factor 2 family protein [Sphingomonas solaris]TVV74717.1 nuclear transport factor 2 family protein [Sphingomonas solaris]
MSAERIADRIAIGEVKARYCRLLDTKQWEQWAALFTDDLVLDTSQAGGPAPIEGRGAAVASVRQFLETARTAHQIHAPEIRFDGADRAEAIFAMQDRVIFEGGPSLTGYGHYTETYVRSEDGWKIARTRLTRLVLDIGAS